MIDLVPMTDGEFQEYREGEIARYADEKVKTGGWDSSDALHRAELELQSFLPNRPSTEGIHFLMIRERDTGDKVGILCYGRPPDGSMSDYYIYDIRIFDRFRRKGYAHRALAKLEHEARNKGMSSLVLHVSVHNRPALRLYEKLGYEVANYRMQKLLRR
jgi:ribosomal protein S18 acetylase RimI-like enzyme